MYHEWLFYLYSLILQSTIIKEVKENRLPHNAKEGMLYGIIICSITVLIMSTVNISLEFGKLDTEVLMIILKSFPIILIIAMLLEVLVFGRIAEKLVHIFSNDTDGFNAKTLFNILFTVIGMSLTMTVIGTMIGKGFTLASFKALSHWPRNFSIALFCELLIAQPPARLVMKKIHLRQESKLIVKDNSSIDFD
ncbi:DUF2798 domain-containing protein [Carnobacterium alterfunditum]|uniref:DUF2798 domain-containing protein n=1 Tax=Carnobacterium alterfunditum TaxID=28230 RepID=UPI001FEAB9B5|nr:DUF2798 domain-containing protein [Carnobacterium alterfunditum]